MAFSDSSAYAIKITDPTGAPVRTLRRPVTPRPVTEAMRRAERQRPGGVLLSSLLYILSCQHGSYMGMSRDRAVAVPVITVWRLPTGIR